MYKIIFQVICLTRFEAQMNQADIFDCSTLKSRSSTLFIASEYRVGCRIVTHYVRHFKILFKRNLIFRHLRTIYGASVENQKIVVSHPFETVEEAPCYSSVAPVGGLLLLSKSCCDEMRMTW